MTTQRCDFDPAKVSFRYNATGYMVEYDGKCLGGAGTKAPSKHWRHRQADLAMYKAAGEREAAKVRAGIGRRDMMKALDLYI